MSWPLKGGAGNTSSVSSVTTEVLSLSKISKSLSCKSDSVNEVIFLGVSGRWEAAATAAAVAAFLFDAMQLSPGRYIVTGVAGEPSLSFFSPNATGIASFVNELHPFAVEVELNPLAGILLPFLRDSFSAMPLESK
jgi:hypothetical protein